MDNIIKVCMVILSIVTSIWELALSVLAINLSVLVIKEIFRKKNKINSIIKKQK